MPFYEYKCENCKNTFETLSSIRDADKQVIECPQCKKLLAHKIPSIFNSTYNKNDESLIKEKSQQKDKANKGHTINFGPYAGLHVDEPVKNMEISNLNFKMSKTSSISVHPKAKVKINNCNFESKD